MMKPISQAVWRYHYPDFWEDVTSCVFRRNAPTEAQMRAYSVRFLTTASRDL